MIHVHIKDEEAVLRQLSSTNGTLIQRPKDSKSRLLLGRWNDINFSWFSSFICILWTWMLTPTSNIWRPSTMFWKAASPLVWNVCPLQSSLNGLPVCGGWITSSMENKWKLRDSGKAEQLLWKCWSWWEINAHGGHRVHMHAVRSYLYALLNRLHRFNIFLMVFLNLFHGDDWKSLKLFLRVDFRSPNCCQAEFLCMGKFSTWTMSRRAWGTFLICTGNEKIILKK